MSNRQYDDLNAHDIQAILDNAAGVIREVDAGSTAYTPEQYQHAQDTQRELAMSDYLDKVRVAASDMSGMSNDRLVMELGTYPS